jgi:outer membrane immunogenic protein
MRNHLVCSIAGAALIFTGLSSAVAADLPVKAPPAPYVPVPTWNGFYGGYNVGYGWSHSSVTASGASLGSQNFNADGVVGGGQIGYNWQTGSWLFGIEADIQGTGQNRDNNFNLNVGGIPFAVASSSGIDYFGTVRGRLGYAFGSTPWLGWLGNGPSLIYVTGGWAYGQASSDFAITSGGTTVVGSTSKTRTDGWTVGGGFENKFAPNWSWGVEYLYLNFGGESTTLATAGGPLVLNGNDFQDHIVRFKLNYYFSSYYR